MLHAHSDGVLMRNVILSPWLLLFLLLTVSIRQALYRADRPPASPSVPERIVSLAPSVTEVLYALNLGSNIAGVTQFCVYPPDVATKPRVAGFSDVNLEAIVRALPDLVVLPIDKIANKEQLAGLGIPVISFDTRSLPGLLRAIKQLGAATGRTTEADSIVDQFHNALREAKENAAGKPRPRVLFSIMHSYQGLGYITEINVIGRDGFYSELIEAAGGQNAYTGSLAFPRLSRESVIFLNPDVIIDVIPTSEHLESVRRDWESLKNVNAVRHNRVFLLTGGADTIPGPRSVLTLAKLSQAFHPGFPSSSERNVP